MPALTVSCPSCSASLRLPSNIPSGKTAKCPRCGAAVPLPPSGDSSVPPLAASSLVDEESRASRPGDRTDAYTPSASDDPLTAFLAPPEADGELGRLGAYRVLDILGKGGMGVVFKAKDTALRREVALKVMLPHVAMNATAKARFLREARAQAAIEHENVIAIYQVEEDNGVPFLAMPLLRGQTLAAALKNHAKPPIPEVLRIGREMAQGLQAAHELDLIHRDIKPANVWLEGAKRRVKILDFGLARTTESDESDDEDGPVTREGSTLGTPAYMSPEQARGGDVDARTDLFSLGVVLFQMCTGELPFKGNDMMAILMSLALETPPLAVTKNPEVPPALSGLIASLLAKDADARPSTAEAVAEELRAIEDAQKYGATFTPVAEDDPWSDLGESEGEDGSLVLSTAHGASGVLRHSPRRAAPAVVLEAAPKSRKPLYLGGGMAACLVLGLGLFFSTRPSPKPADAGTVENKDPAPKTRPTGLPLYSLAFHGGGHVEAPPFELPSTGPFTMEAFITPSENPRHCEILGQPGGSRLYVIGDRVHFHYESDTGGPTPSFTPIPRGKRVHIAGVKTDTEARLYVDGKMVQRGGHTNSAVRSVPHPWQIGHPDYYGLISEVRVSKGARYDGDFTPAPRFEPDRDTLVLYHCDDGRGTSLKDSSSFSRDGLLSEVKWAKTSDPVPTVPIVPIPVAPPSVPVPPGDYALYYDGTARVDAPTLGFPAAAPMTLEAYVTPHMDRVQGLPIIVGRHGANSIYFGDTNIKVLFRSPGSSDLLGNYEKNKRFHFAGVHTGTKVLMFLDGKLVASRDVQAPTIAQGVGLSLGENGFSGLIDEIRVSATARYEQDFVPAPRFEPDPATIALYHFDEGTGDQLKDSSGNNHHGVIKGGKWVKADGSPTGAVAPPAAGINLLPLVDLTKDVANGIWERRGAELVTRSGFGPNTHGILEFPYQAPEEYDLILDFTRTLQPGEVSVGFAHERGASRYFLGSGKSLFGVVRMDGQLTLQPLPAFPPDTRRHQTRLEVRRGRITGYFDGQLVLDTPVEGKKLEHDPSFKPRDERLLSLFMHSGESVVHGFQVVEVTGRGTITRGPPATGIDLLRLVDPAKDVVKGTWERKDADLVGKGIADNGNHGVIEFPYRPPAEYDVTIEFTRLPGNFDVAPALSMNGRSFQCCLNVGGQYFGFNLVDAKPIQLNPAQAKPELALALNKRHVCRMEVRKNKLTAYLDGVKFHELNTDGSNLSMYHLTKLRDDQLLGLTLKGGPITVHRADVVEITGKGTFTRAVPPINLMPMIDPAQDAVTRLWKRVGTEIVAEALPGNCLLEVPYIPPDEYDVLMDFTRTGGGGEVSVCVNRQGRQCRWVQAARGDIFGFSMLNGETIGDKPEFRRPELALVNGRRYSTRVEVRRDRLSGFLDGVLINEVKTDGTNLSPAGGAKLRDDFLLGVTVAGGSGAVVHRFEIAEITGKGQMSRSSTTFAPTLADRKAAEALHSHANLGLLLGDGRTVNIPIPDMLPSEPFVLTRIWFQPSPKYPENYAATVFLPAVEELKDVVLIEDQSRRMLMTADELKTFAKMPFAPRLTRLALNVPITTATLETLGAFPRLHYLMGAAEETDRAALEQITKRIALRELGLRGLGASGKVTAADCAILATMPLTRLDLTRLQITDPAFATALTRLPELNWISFGLGAVNDDFVKELARCPKLSTLDLPSTRITDAGLTSLAGLSTLRSVNTGNTMVTEAGARKLAVALPQCRISYPGGVYDPPK